MSGTSGYRFERTLTSSGNNRLYSASGQSNTITATDNTANFTGIAATADGSWMVCQAQNTGTGVLHTTGGSASGHGSVTAYIFGGASNNTNFNPWNLTTSNSTKSTTLNPSYSLGQPMNPGSGRCDVTWVSGFSGSVTVNFAVTVDEIWDVYPMAAALMVAM